MSTTIPVPSNIGSMAASQLVGALLNYFLYGIMTLQVYVYRLSFPQDKKLIKWLVYGVFFMETLMTGFNGVDIYLWFAAGFGDMLQLSKPLISPFYSSIMGSIIALVVQGFFCYRIYIIKREALWFCVIIAVFSFVQMIGGFGAGILAYLPENEVNRHNRTLFIYLWLVCGMIANILISGGMAFLLTKARAQHPRRSNDLAKRIVRLVIGTNALSTGFSILSVIIFGSAPNTTYWVGPTLLLSKLYANTLFVTFNNRTFVRPRGTYAALTPGMSDSYAARSRARNETPPLSAGFGLESTVGGHSRQNSETSPIAGSEFEFA
ncbi:hypothetical protein B0H10DRAFT_2105583 [Mycena sp. CBHHK59/15]|nr:hypothetical protein B0H10DRAFT_2105583 [Mycena sp. CBHHK59/15]